MFFAKEFGVHIRNACKRGTTCCSRVAADVFRVWHQPPAGFDGIDASQGWSVKAPCILNDVIS